MSKNNIESARNSCDQKEKNQQPFFHILIPLWATFKIELRIEIEFICGFTVNLGIPVSIFTMFKMEISFIPFVVFYISIKSPFEFDFTSTPFSFNSPPNTRIYFVPSKLVRHRLFRYPFRFFFGFVECVWL